MPLRHACRAADTHASAGWMPRHATLMLTMIRCQLRFAPCRRAALLLRIDDIDAGITADTPLITLRRRCADAAIAVIDFRCCYISPCFAAMRCCRLLIIFHCRFSLDILLAHFL